MITAKMWEYISGVSKVVDKKKNKNPLKATREYENTRTTDVVRV